MIIILNIASYIFSWYEFYVAKNVQSGYMNVDNEVLPDKTCPDQLVMEKEKPFAYKERKGYLLKDQAAVNWINSNCPNAKR